MSVKDKHGSIPLLIDGDRMVTADADKADVLNRTFADKFTRRHVTRFPTAPDHSLDPLQTFTVDLGPSVLYWTASDPIRPLGRTV